MPLSPQRMADGPFKSNFKNVSTVEEKNVDHQSTFKPTNHWANLLIEFPK